MRLSSLGLPSFTAEAVALHRALEASWPPERRILDDPYARHLLSPPGRALAALARSSPRAAAVIRGVSLPAVAAYVVARHAYLDALLLRQLTAGAEQVVILGAGYDTRALRFREPIGARPLYEVDHPTTQRHKRRRAESARLPAPAPGLRWVAMDFEVESLRERLLSEGFARGARTAWIWEGVSMYLHPEAVDATLASLRDLSGPASTLGMDVWTDSPPDARTARYDRFRGGLSLLGEPLRFAISPHALPDWATERGYEVSDLTDGRGLAAQYGRGRDLYQGCAVCTLRVR